jgi:hypothetical protein
MSSDTTLYIIRLISWYFFVRVYAVILHFAYCMGKFAGHWRYMGEFNKYLKMFVPPIRIPSLNEGKIVSL